MVRAEEHQVKVRQHNSTLSVDTDKPLKRTTGLRRTEFPSDSGGNPRRAKRRQISPASPAQRAKVKDARCVVCAKDRYEAVIHPAHLASRAQGGGDDPLDVVPLCAFHHLAFDQHGFDLLPYLEPRWREEVAQCVRHLGLVGAFQRLTNERWVGLREEGKTDG